MIQDYSKYQFRLCDYFIVAIICTASCIGIGVLFYRSILAGFFLFPCSLYLIKKYRDKKLRERNTLLSLQFKDALSSLSSLLEAGYSIEKAIPLCITDLLRLYPVNSFIVLEFQRISSMIQNSISAEEAFEQFAQRTMIEDIISFSEIFRAAKKSGGDLVAIIQKTSHTLTEKAEVKQEIQSMITAKKMEVTIMKVMPFGILFYLNVFSSSFLSPLYHNLFGILFMTGILLVILGISLWADHIMKIEL